MALGELAFKIGRRIGKHPIAGRLFCLTERLLPVKRVAREHGLVAFHHPRPVAEPHILIVPTTPVASITTHKLDDDAMFATIWSMVELAQRVSDHLPPNQGWQLVINGGERQDIGQMHGHLLHSDADSMPDAFPLYDPADDTIGWSALLSTLRDASEISGAGCSLIIRWNWGEQPAARVTQSRHA